MTQVEIRIRFPFTAGPADLEVLTPHSVDPAETIARLLPGIGIRAHDSRAVQTPFGTITHVSASEPDGSTLSPLRASMAVSALRASLGAAVFDAHRLR